MRFLLLVFYIGVIFEINWSKVLPLDHSRQLKRVPCVPDFWKPTGRNGHCSATRDLEDCANQDQEISFSSDCVDFDGSWCCYDPRPASQNKEDRRKQSDTLQGSYDIYGSTESPATLAPTIPPVEETTVITMVGPVRPVAPSSTSHYDYTNLGEFGPLNWHKHFPTCNSSGQQSPINIETIAAGTALDSTDLTFVDYEAKARSWMVMNHENTFEFNGSFADGFPQIEGGSLPGRYAFLQGHFHWGPEDSQGSEHFVDGHQFPLELHLVHVRIPVADDKRPSRTRLAVIGILYEISNTPNPELEILLDHLSNVRSPDSSKNFTSEILTMNSFLPDNKDFYRYLGSLTVPPCNEAVVWTVLKTPKTISSSQLAQLRTLLDENNQPMTINYRPVQPLHNRRVAFHNRDFYLLNL